MKVQIVKFLSSKGKILEMRKDNFKGRDLPENIIEEYEVEIKGDGSNETDWLEDLKRKHKTGNYILIWNNIFNPPYGWKFCTSEKLIGHNQSKLIHIKHKDIIEAYLKNPSVEIETGMFAPMTGETEPSKWVDLEKDFIEDYNEEFWYRLKVKDLAWYEEKDSFRVAVKQIKSLNDYTEKDGKVYIMEKVTDTKGVSSYSTNGYHTPLQWLECYRPATESEVLSLVYKPQQKISKEDTLAESNRLKDLFLNNEAECLVENEQEFNEVYDFLKNKNTKGLNLPSRGEYNLTFPTLIICENRWGNLFEWNTLKNRDIDKPLIKYSNEIFSLVKQGE